MLVKRLYSTLTLFRIEFNKQNLYIYYLSIIYIISHASVLLLHRLLHKNAKQVCESLTEFHTPPF